MEESWFFLTCEVKAAAAAAQVISRRLERSHKPPMHSTIMSDRAIGRPSEIQSVMRELAAIHVDAEGNPVDDARQRRRAKMRGLLLA